MASASESKIPDHLKYVQGSFSHFFSKLRILHVGIHFKDFDFRLQVFTKFLGENKGLIVAEVELGNEDQPFEKPDWIGEEVTGDPKYFNSNLVQHPFTKW